MPRWTDEDMENLIHTQYKVYEEDKPKNDNKKKDNNWIFGAVIAVIFLGLILLFNVAAMDEISTGTCQEMEQDWQEYERLTGNERPIDWHYEEMKYHDTD